METTTTVNLSDWCEQYEKGLHIDERLYLVTIFGSLVALLSMVNNALLIYVLSRPLLASSQLFYLLCLAVFDTFTAFSYILLFPTQVLYDYLESLTLYKFWNQYVTICYALTHTAMTASTYLIVAASADRRDEMLAKIVYHAQNTFRCYSTVVKRNCHPFQRYLVVVFIVVLGLLSKGITYWELDVVHKPECSGFETYQLSQTQLAKNAFYKTVMILWFRTVANVFLPFFLLIILNAIIIFNLRQSDAVSAGWSGAGFLIWRSRPQEPLSRGAAAPGKAGAEAPAAKQRRQNVRAATRMLLVLVGTYLLANLLNVVISVWENVDARFLFEHRSFYTFSTDVITMMTVVTGSIRLPIYCTCNKQVRSALRLLREQLRQSLLKLPGSPRDLRAFHPAGTVSREKPHAKGQFRRQQPTCR